MAILNRDDFFARVNSMVGENSSDEAIAFVEDMSDTYNALASQTEEAADWERRYHENDEAWRRKYQNRFFRGDAEIVVDNSGGEEEIPPDEVTIDDLFE